MRRPIVVAVVLALALALVAMLLRYDYVSPDERVDRFTGRPEFRRTVSEWGESDGVMTHAPRAEWLDEREFERWLQRQRAEESRRELDRLEIELELLQKRARDQSRGD